MDYFGQSAGMNAEIFVEMRHFSAIYWTYIFLRIQEGRNAEGVNIYDAL